ncbi:MAG: hypothetical protein AAB652_01500 [Patescibacteria group bacterium]
MSFERSSNFENQEGQPENFSEMKRVFKEEEGILAQFRGKAKGIAKVLALVSTMSLGMAVAQETWAGQEGQGEQKSNVEQIEKAKEKIGEERAVELLSLLYNLPDTPGANQAKNLWGKQEAARIMIKLFSLDNKLGFPELKAGEKLEGTPSIIDIKNGLHVIGNATGLFADKMFGNKDGNPDIEEMQKLQVAMKDSVGLQEYIEMEGEVSALSRNVQEQ